MRGGAGTRQGWGAGGIGGGESLSKPRRSRKAVRKEEARRLREGPECHRFRTAGGEKGGEPRGGKPDASSNLL